MSSCRSGIAWLTGLVWLSCRLDLVHRVACDLLRLVDQLLARFAHVLMLELRLRQRKSNCRSDRNSRGANGERVFVDEPLQTASGPKGSFFRLVTKIRN